MEWNRDLGSIPNKVGLRIFVLLTSGYKRSAKIVKDAEGCHILEDIKITDITAWQYAQPSDVNWPN